MERQRVNLAAAVSVGYDCAAETLEVEHESGGVCQYYNVPESIHQQLLSADSIGAFLNIHIKAALAGSRVDEK